MGDIRSLWKQALIVRPRDRPRDRIGADVASGLADLEAYGQMVLANPDFVARVKSRCADERSGSAPASLAAPRGAAPTIPRSRRPQPRKAARSCDQDKSSRQRSRRARRMLCYPVEVDMKIGVSGASGCLGRAVVSELLQRPGGHEVVAITRTPETVSGPAQGRFGDYNRPESLAEAYAGLDRLLIITTVDPEPGKRGAQNVAAIDAAVKAGVKHIVFMSAAGTRQEEEPARGASYWRGEQHLIATAPAWTILRMNFYAEAFVQQAQASLDQGVLTGLAENRVAFVARDDVAAAAAGILIGDGHAGAIYNATGPERLSGAERAALIAEITGRPLAFRVITEEQLRAGLTQAGLPVGVVNTVISIQASFAAGAFDIVTGDVERLGGRPPKPLRDVLAGALKSPSA